MSFRQGARQFFERRGAPTPPLPYDAEVQYLESTGTQFIDLCVYGNINFVAKIRACATAHDYIYPLFGARTSYNSNGFSIYNGRDVGYKYTVSFDSVYSSSSDIVSDVSSDVSDWVDFTLGLHTKIGTWEKDYTSRAKTFTTQNYLLLFAWNSAGSILMGKYRVSEFRLYDGGVLIQDFIPVRFTNALGVSEGAMYDRVSGQLFRNAGTGAFLWAEKQ